ncbi:hypothetical protein [Bradyrhizobium sp. RT4b]|uniref:hypothetical protein n=1 Tax=Bradyrhizobium sp. RT4b TaxID=3156379 RepID=UPI003391A768
MPKKPTPKGSKTAKAQEPPQRQLVYAGPPGLGEALRKLRPAPETEYIREGRRLLDRMTSGHTGATPRKPRKPKATREGARLLSQDQIDRGTAHLVNNLDDPKQKNPRRWRTQRTAAKEIAKFLGLPEESAQTIEDWIVIPLFDLRGIHKPKK